MINLINVQEDLERIAEGAIGQAVKLESTGDHKAQYQTVRDTMEMRFDREPLPSEIKEAQAELRSRHRDMLYRVIIFSKEQTYTDYSMTGNREKLYCCRGLVQHLTDFIQYPTNGIIQIHHTDKWMSERYWVEKEVASRKISDSSDKKITYILRLEITSEIRIDKLA